MKSKEIEVLTNKGKELTNKMVNVDPKSEEYRITVAKFHFLLDIMEELAKV